MSEYVVEEPSCDGSASWRVRESIVRCRDCSLCVEKGYRLYCDRDAGGFPEVEPNGFCSWGERRDA